MVDSIRGDEGCSKEKLSNRAPWTAMPHDMDGKLAEESLTRFPD